MSLQSIVTIEQGTIQGKIQSDIRNRPFLSFCGIPYAKSPIGDLRFKDPQLAEPWTGIRDCTNDGDCCYAAHFFVNGKEYNVVTTGSEDCLFLNVFTHKLKENGRDSLKPVMVWIPCGGFVTGSNSTQLYGPEMLMTEDIVLVTINYRVGVLGFLSIKNKEIGNAGLKDQVQALKWIKKNISQFGGDPECVTIFGASSGAASVHYLMLSPSAKGLFHRGIAQSGSVLSAQWARGQENNAATLARVLDCPDTDEDKILTFLQNLSVEKLLEGYKKLFDEVSETGQRLFCPTLEAKCESAFLCEEPLELIRTGRFSHVPLMTGCTSQEGLLVPWLVNLGIDAFPYIVPPILAHDQTSTSYKDAERRISQFYFGCDTPDEDNKTALYNIYTDNYFLRGVYVAARAFAQTSTEPVYLYKMTAETKLNAFKTVLQTSEPGVCHVDDLGYLFKNIGTPDITPGSVEDAASRKFLKLWTNFARYGNPTPTSAKLLDDVVWKSVDTRQMNFLELGTDLRTDTNLESERMAFWDELFKSVPGY